MTIFGKNYDKEIKELSEKITKLISTNNHSIDSIKELNKQSEFLQSSMTKMAKIQAQQKAMVVFLLNHASIDESAKDDLNKMLQEVMKVEKEIKE